MPKRMGIKTFGVITPYIIPSNLKTKKANLGDGLILHAIERLIGTFGRETMFTSRSTASTNALDTFAKLDGVFLAGANQLTTDFSVLPGLTADVIREKNLKFIPFGIGLHETVDDETALTENSKEVLLTIHQLVEFSSWRCPITLNFLERNLPTLKGRMIMTGCPVVFDSPLLSGSKFAMKTDRIAVTVTERGDFWARETSILDFVSSSFKRSERFLVLHQDFLSTETEGSLNDKLASSPTLENKIVKLRSYAIERGFKIVVPSSVVDCQDLYRTIDLHFGSRLHAHLYFLSQNKRSFFVPIDRRGIGIAMDLEFPLCSYLEMGNYLDFDFERVRNRARLRFSDMSRFIKSL